jgi:hypothetical protein
MVRNGLGEAASGKRRQDTRSLAKPFITHWLMAGLSGNGGVENQKMGKHREATGIFQGQQFPQGLPKPPLDTAAK